MSMWRYSLRLTNRLFINATKQKLPDVRLAHRWVSPTFVELNRRRAKLEPQPEARRSDYLEWNYDIEIRCFCSRLKEQFDENILRKAFVQQEWANLKEFKAQEAGDDSFIPLENNFQLAQEGMEILQESIKEFYSKLYPADVTNIICNYLTSDDTLAHVAKYLGTKDLIKSTEYPPEIKTYADAFRAIVAALAHSVDMNRLNLFIKDFVIVQMNGKELYDIWIPEKPFDYLLSLLQQKGIADVEPRLCNQSATNTILANYQVGLYNSSDKSCLGLGWGENIETAKDTAALDAIQRIYSNYVNNNKEV